MAIQKASARFEVTAASTRLAAAALSVTVTVTLLLSDCGIANHGTAVQVAAAASAHPVLVASAR